MSGQPRLPEMQGSFSLLQGLLAEQIRPSRGVWLITRQAQATGDDWLSPTGHAMLGLRRTAALEFPELALQHLELDSAAGAGDLLRAIGNAAGPEILLRGNRLLVPRLLERTSTPGLETNEELVPAQSGLIDDLQTTPADRQQIRDDEVEIAVHAHGINFRDVMTALDMLPAMLPSVNPRLGGECAGIVVQAGPLSGFRPGQRVFAFAPASFKRFVTVRGTDVAAVPDRLTLAQAAALPVVYLTALYGLDRLAALQPGQSILIHSAAGGLGLAAINIAKGRGAIIFATAGSEEKRAYLHSLGIKHVFPSRTTGFADEVMHLTQSRGVDVALNSLTGDLAEKTLSVLSRNGCFLEVGKRDTLGSAAVHLARPDVRHFIYDLGEEAAKDSSLVPTLLKRILAAIAADQIEPLPVTEFSEPRQAFRYLAQARHIGKVVVTRSDTTAIAVPPPIHANATYLITGGFGSLGLLFAEWLVDRGARHLTLIGRSAPGAFAQDALQQMRSRGAEITLASADVADRAAMETILQNIPTSAPLRAVLHTAGILDDRSLLDQSPASLAAVLRPKLQGAWNLHLLTRDLDLDFFVLFSSAAALLGSPGQSNYAVANATLDALAAYRHTMGLPALSIQWGPWHSDGMTRKLKADPSSIGLGRIAPAEGYAALETLLASNEAVAAVLPVASWNQLFASRSTALSSLIDSLAHAGSGTPKPAAPAPTAAEAECDPFRIALMTSTGLQRRAIMMEHLRQFVVQILSLPEPTKIDEDEALHDLGLDSLMAVELRNALVSSLRRDLPATTVLDYPTLRTLTDFLLVERLEASSPNREPDKFTEIDAMSETDLKEISESEAEALLLAELRKQ
ncbi:MAG TPA: SDR family NAD(P)-dependent oxidoreductase [Acidobacteriaceae bacterium]|nr:SDR family NAD(P)-dependent oxidoreductase [Acidobacteriaceae bacterium]